MTVAEIQHRYREVIALLDEKRLKEAFDRISVWLSMLPDVWQIADKLSEAETAYRYLTQYMLDGCDDPDRQQMYGKLMLTAYTLADRTEEALLAAESNTLYFQKKRYFRQLADTSIQNACKALDKAYNELSLQLLAEENDDTRARQKQLREKTERAREELFTLIWTNYPATEDDYAALKACLSPDRYPAETASAVVAALLLNLLQRYDERKIGLLLSAYTEWHDDEVRQRALCSALMLLYIYRSRAALSTALTAHLESLKEQEGFARDTRNIFLQLIRSREAERISKKLTEELLPEMMKLSPSLYKKINPSPNDGEGTPDKNPEWQELLEQSGIADKIKEMNDLQMEGSDVFLSTFSNLKSFSFFNDIGNWFAPFYAEHSAVQDIFPARGSGGDTFLKLLGSSRFLCNSDKYSFCLSLKQVSEAQRQMMTSQFNSESADLEQLEKERTSLSGEELSKSIANQYIQDLYRFFKLHSRREEFYDPFAEPVDLLQLPSLQSVLGDENTMRLIAEFYFKKEFYTDALAVFERLTEQYGADNGIYQKTGYCLQTLGEYEKALNVYLRAEMIQPDNLWTIRRIAACYRSLKNSAKALAYYLRAAELQPDSLAIGLNIGHCYVEAKNYEEALKYYFKVDYLAPDSGKAWRPIAWCSFLVGKKEQAQRYYEKILNDKPTATDYMNAGHVELAFGHVRRALDLYRESLAAEGGDLRRFRENFKQDIPDLVRAGIRESDIPILLDQLLYRVS